VVPSTGGQFVAHDGCSADIVATNCKRDDGQIGVRHQVSNGTCSAALDLTAAGTSNAAAQLRVPSFSASSECMVLSD
jgi:hypothetical protein